MCNCEQESRKLILDNFINEYPEQEKHSVEIEGYIFQLVNKMFVQKGSFTVNREAIFTHKNGNKKRRNLKINLVFTYCPFCGKPYDDTE